MENKRMTEQQFLDNLDNLKNTSISMKTGESIPGGVTDGPDDETIERIVEAMSEKPKTGENPEIDVKTGLRKP